MARVNELYGIRFFELPAYEKCVSYGTESPRSLDDFAQRLFAEADMPVDPKAPRQ